jgi:hypothetical protein
MCFKPDKLTPREIEQEIFEYGKCRRYPDHGGSFSPKADYWCGEYKPKEASK